MVRSIYCEYHVILCTNGFVQSDTSVSVQSPVRNFHCGLFLILTFFLNLLHLINNIFTILLHTVKWFQNVTFINTLYRGETSTVCCYWRKYNNSYMNFFCVFLKLEAWWWLSCVVETCKFLDYHKSDMYGKFVLLLRIILTQRG